MSSPGSLQATGSGTLQPYDTVGALERLPARQARWVLGSVGGALLTALTGLWVLQPEIALTLAIAAGASVVNPRQLWAAPLVATGVTIAGLLCYAMGVPAVIGAGAAAGALATWMLPQRTDWIDWLNGSLAGLAGSAIGLWAAWSILPAALPAGVSALLTAGIVGLIGSQGLLPAALRFDQEPQTPSLRQVQRALKVVYRPAVFRALELYKTAQPQAPDVDTRRGLAEVATWGVSPSGHPTGPRCRAGPDRSGSGPKPHPQEPQSPGRCR